MNPLELTKVLLQKPSLTPNDAGCLDLISTLLTQAGFVLQSINRNETQNLFAHTQNTGPLFVFVGHTDVVPTGPLDQWQFPPFSATENASYLYGRGAADMKSAVAAMTCALIDFKKTTPNAAFRAGLLLTSDEEGNGKDGISYVMEFFQKHGIKIDYALVGEPSSSVHFGDTIKIGRRGSLSGKLILLGKQGHIAYPEHAQNPIHLFAKILHELIDMQWDEGNAHFQATRLQFSNIHAGTGANNVIPGQLSADFNFRYSTENTAEALQKAFTDCLEKHKVSYQINWHRGGLPFLTKTGILLDATKSAVKSISGIVPQLSTIGGTSDGRFIAPTGSEVIEFGLINQTIHQINECAKIDDIEKLYHVYLQTLKNLHDLLAQ